MNILCIRRFIIDVMKKTNIFIINLFIRVFTRIHIRFRCIFFFFSKSLCLSNCFFMIRSKRNVLAIKICSNDFFFFDLLRFQWTRRIQKCVRRFLIGWFDDFFSFRVKRTNHRVFYSLWCGFLYPEHIIPVGEKAAEFLHDTSQSVHFPPDGTKYFSKFSTIRPLGFFRETLFGLGVV